jgi:hypothetical protein
VPTAIKSDSIFAKHRHELERLIWHAIVKSLRFNSRTDPSELADMRKFCLLIVTFKTSFASKSEDAYIY